MPTTRGGCASVETSASSAGSTVSPATSNSTGSTPAAAAASTRSSPSATNRPSFSRQRRSASFRTSLSFSFCRELISAERGLRLRRDRAEGGRVVHREVGEHLAVERDVRLSQPGDELVVREPVLARRRVDTHDPDPAEGALAVLPIAIGVDERVVDLLLRVPVARLLEPPVALRLLEDLAPLLARVDGPLHARHLSASRAAASPLACRRAIRDRPGGSSAYASPTSSRGCGSSWRAGAAACPLPTL